jgi:hypothetical protein
MCAAVLVIGWIGLADGAAAGEQQDYSRPLTLDEAPPGTLPPKSESLLNDVIDKIGLGKLRDDWGIKAGGFVEGSYTYNMRAPGSDINEARLFDFEHNAARLNQIALQFARPIDAAADAKAGKWDWGWGVDQMWGSDGRLIHANALSAYSSATHPINQYDLTQAYLDIFIPVGNGLTVRMGKFVTLMGEETISPIATVTGSSGNALYSHSYSFGFGIPFTQTGVLATYALNDKLTITGGFTRGWEQSTSDVNGAIDFLGEVVWAMSDEWKFTFNASIGPQRAKDNSDYRYDLEGIAAYSPKGSKWTFSADSIFAWEEHARVSSGNTAYWYGVTAYAGWAVCDYATLNGRAEWFRDDGGSRLGIDSSFYEFTVGMAIKPFPHDKIGSNLVIRPEVRYDYANKSAFDGGRKHDQSTAAIDAIFAL